MSVRDTREVRESFEPIELEEVLPTAATLSRTPPDLSSESERERERQREANIHNMSWSLTAGRRSLGSSAAAIRSCGGAVADGRWGTGLAPSWSSPSFSTSSSSPSDGMNDDGGGKQMDVRSSFQYCVNRVRQYDYENYLCTFALPPHHRPVALAGRVGTPGGQMGYMDDTETVQPHRVRARPARGRPPPRSRRRCTRPPARPCMRASRRLGLHSLPGVGCHQLNVCFEPQNTRGDKCQPYSPCAPSTSRPRKRLARRRSRTWRSCACSGRVGTFVRGLVER
jgi:hypothetical protein